MDYTKLIYKVLSGQASEADKEALNTWLAEDPVNEEEYGDIKLLYQADQDFDKHESERDEHFYDGFRNVKLRMAGVKRSQKIARVAVTVGASIMIAALIVGIAWYQIHASRKAGITTLPEKAQSTLRLVENLVFEDVTLKMIFETLESRYQVTIHTRNRKLLACRFTGTFYRGTSVTDMLYTLAQSGNFNLTAKASKTFELQGEGCSV